MAGRCGAGCHGIGCIWGLAVARTVLDDEIGIASFQFLKWGRLTGEAKHNLSPASHDASSSWGTTFMRSRGHTDCLLGKAFFRFHSICSSPRRLNSESHLYLACVQFRRALTPLASGETQASSIDGTEGIGRHSEGKGYRAPIWPGGLAVGSSAAPPPPPPAEGLGTGGFGGTMLEASGPYHDSSSIA